ncbi:MAG: C4-dicarboxylate ABC transporter substrate-binding protein [Alphaproteobacteria bacterium]|nr:C4-dicarboxylate ABC transporter substrate-binding protein [Alphaproteobacteria bacterium]
MRNNIRRNSLAAGLFAACLGAGMGEAAAQDRVQWRHAMWGPSREVTRGIEAVAAYVQEKSGGKFTIRIHYGEQLSDAKDHLDGLKLGAFESAQVCASYHPGKNPAMTVLDLPFLPIATFDAMERVHEAFYTLPEVGNELERWNARTTFSTILPQYEFMGSGNAPKSLDDWKGMRVRALGGLGDVMRTLGAIPTSVTASETYSSLERGVVQAVSLPYSFGFHVYRVHEISKWYTVGLNLGSLNCPNMIGIEAWKKLSPEFQKLIVDSKPLAYAALKKAYEAADAKYEPEFDKKKLQRVDVSPALRQEFIERAAKPVWAKWVQENADKVPSQKLFDFVLAEAKKAAGS